MRRGSGARTKCWNCSCESDVDLRVLTLPEDSIRAIFCCKRGAEAMRELLSRAVDAFEHAIAGPDAGHRPVARHASRESGAGTGRRNPGQGAAGQQRGDVGQARSANGRCWLDLPASSDRGSGHADPHRGLAPRAVRQVCAAWMPRPPSRRVSRAGLGAATTPNCWRFWCAARNWSARRSRSCRPNS